MLWNRPDYRGSSREFGMNVAEFTRLLLHNKHNSASCCAAFGSNTALKTQRFPLTSSGTPPPRGPAHFRAIYQISMSVTILASQKNNTIQVKRLFCCILKCVVVFQKGCTDCSTVQLRRPAVIKDLTCDITRCSEYKHNPKPSKRKCCFHVEEGKKKDWAAAGLSLFGSGLGFLCF